MNRSQRRVHLMIWVCAAAAMATLIAVGLQSKQGTERHRAVVAQQMEPR